MNILTLGASGFIGSALVEGLRSCGHDVVASTRGAARSNEAVEAKRGGLAWIRWDGVDAEALAPALDGVDAVVNLLGENLAARRWTPEQKARIVQSRVRSAQALCRAFAVRAAEGKSVPRTLIQASACGYYGLWDDMEHAPLCTEESPAGRGFLAETCLKWEAASRQAEDFGVRRCLLRTAPVLGPGGGFLQKMLPAFRLGLGGSLGSGRQPLSWIFLDDAVRAVLHLLEHERLQGPFNLSSPQPASMARFVAALGQALRRPTFFRVPACILRLTLGEMAEEMLLAGQAAAPAKLTASGFAFACPDLKQALERTLARRNAS